MLGHNPQSEEEFIAASHDLLSGQTVEQTLTDHPEYSPEIGQMLRLVEALKDLPAPALSSDALSRLEKRTQLAAKQRQTDPQPEPTIPHLSIVRPTSTQPPATNFTPDRQPLLPLKPRKLNTIQAVALVAILVLTSLSIIGILALQNGYFNKPQQLESYTGIIATIEPTRWILADNAEMQIDNLTEIHGNPAVGAKMTCLAEKLPGHERYHALEVWILTDPTPQKAGMQVNAIP